MQKPQQRKYHSSCNRSVHTGTAHGKQRVKVCKRKTPHLLVRSFLSPYGDGTKMAMENQFVYKFSPPCGDCTKSCAIWLDGRLFSPPYGDGTHFPATPKRSRQFSPPYGEKLKSGTKTLMAWQRSFCPLTGIVPLVSSIVGKGMSFRPLTGMVPSACFWNSRKVGFRPLTGMVRARLSFR